MTILDKIIAFKKTEIAKIKAEVSVKKLVESPNFDRKVFSLKKSLLEVGSTGIIAEFKRQSPSKGIINDTATIADVTNGYLDANVAAQSILTDTSFFGGSMADLMEARVINQQKPILRKDFIVDGFQIVEAKAIGADVILLIASCLTSQEIKNFGQLATDLGLEVLYEVHTQEDLDKINDLDHKIIGINNRNLKTFKVDLEHSIKLANQIPDTSLKVSESGISDPRIITGLKEYGFQGFLIGENFMKEDNPGEACKEFISQIR
ncbi:indole-3-glycerol phosphate synthase TrpC [Polaribacter litorisediminis]|uniref:indole-3-glycerol phosphate synthase TrpC n=1 Tax=Polaribacter litorisediminis TaxID=1908341 RepID=UPI001CBCC070|nr:indole-3-glycerol phosphate synthase TrpC [Polaribacter litorisediminis]UAM97041.1 indole-3-glycerol phosphate synthase TrpC [Polaribacter litorisediminis]